LRLSGLAADEDAVGYTLRAVDPFQPVEFFWHPCASRYCCLPSYLVDEPLPGDEFLLSSYSSLDVAPPLPSSAGTRRRESTARRKRPASASSRDRENTGRETTTGAMPMRAGRFLVFIPAFQDRDGSSVRRATVIDRQERLGQRDTRLSGPPLSRSPPELVLGETWKPEQHLVRAMLDILRQRPASNNELEPVVFGSAGHPGRPRRRPSRPSIFAHLLMAAITCANADRASSRRSPSLKRMSW